MIQFSSTSTRPVACCSRSVSSSLHSAGSTSKVSTAVASVRRGNSQSTIRALRCAGGRADRQAQLDVLYTRACLHFLPELRSTGLACG